MTLASVVNTLVVVTLSLTMVSPMLDVPAAAVDALTRNDESENHVVPSQEVLPSLAEPVHSNPPKYMPNTERLPDPVVGLLPTLKPFRSARSVVTTSINEPD
jgi:hypothetical protein